MPHSSHRKKSVRQTATRTLANRRKASAMKTAIRRVQQAVEEGDGERLKRALPAAYKRIDKAAKGNVIHAKTASRRKALVARTANKLAAS